jgi:hypothetical protein
VVQRDRRCEHTTTYRVAGAEGALDDYTHVCTCHLELVHRPGDVVERRSVSQESRAGDVGFDSEAEQSSIPEVDLFLHKPVDAELLGGLLRYLRLQRTRQQRFGRTSQR